MTMTSVRVAAAQYPVDWHDNWEHFANKASRWVEAAVREEARLLLFPEYGSLELTSLFGAAVAKDLAGQLDALQSLREDFAGLWQELAHQHGVWIAAPSFPWRTDTGSYVNRAIFCHPDREPEWQDKLIMTRFEAEQWHVSPAETGPQTFATPFGGVGIAICYDSEFPLIAHRQVTAGADIILVPSCTDAPAGYHRVRIGSQARALENQCYTIQSPLVGEAPWSAAVDVNVGAAGFYSPPDRGFPDNGVLKMGEWNRPTWVVQDLDLDRVRELRTSGQVLNHRDWDRQPS